VYTLRIRGGATTSKCEYNAMKLSRSVKNTINDAARYEKEY
jgi:hypothetical protein